MSLSLSITHLMLEAVVRHPIYKTISFCREFLSVVFSADGVIQTAFPLVVSVS